jgi:hypothetical protein
MGRMTTIAFSKHCNSEMRQYSSLELRRRSAMITIRDLFEAHLTAANLQRSMSFFGDALGLELAQVFPERKVAFYWIGRRGDSMIGLWEAESVLHCAGK